MHLIFDIPCIFHFYLRFFLFHLQVSFTAFFFFFESQCFLFSFLEIYFFLFWPIVSGSKCGCLHTI